MSSFDDRQVQVQSIMTQLPLQTSPPSSTVKELADQMNNYGRGAIIIVDNKNHPVGIITERDIVRRVVSAGKDPNKVAASEVMSQPIITADPEMSVHSAALTMTKYKIRRLPVVRDTMLYGIVTAGDMAKMFYERNKRDPTLAAMSRFQLIEQQAQTLNPELKQMYIVGLDAKGIINKAITLDPEMTVMDARNTMLKYNISRIVVSKDHEPLGILTEKDIARFLYAEVPSRRFDEITVDEIMCKELVTVEEASDLRECAKLMLEKAISSLIVLDDQKKLKGIFTKSDLRNAYVEHFAGEHLISEFMTRRVLTVSPDEAIHMAILLMSSHRVSRIVVAEDNHPIGIITGRDLLPVSAVFGTGTFGKYWTLKEALYGDATHSQVLKRKPVEAYLKMQGRFEHMLACQTGKSNPGAADEGG